MTNETQAPLYLTLSPTSYKLVDIYYPVLSHCWPVSSLYSQFFDFLRRGLSLRKRRTAAAPKRWKNSPFDEKATGKGGGHRRNWRDGRIIGGGKGWGMHWLVICMYINSGLKLFGKKKQIFLIRYTQMEFCIYGKIVMCIYN